MSLNLLYFGNFVIATITLLLFDVLCVRLRAQQTPSHRYKSMRTEWFLLCGSDARIRMAAVAKTKNAIERISHATIPPSTRKVKEQLASGRQRQRAHALSHVEMFGRAARV